MRNELTALYSSRIRELSRAYWPVILALLLVLPRLISAEFGLFDDPAAIRFSQGIEQGDWSVLAIDAESGRFRPLYWLQYAVTYLLAGPQPFWFYIVNSFVFVALTIELIWLVTRMGGSRRLAWMAGALFVLAGPVIENIYTLMKPELLQFALILGAILPFAAPASHPAGPRRMGLFAILSTAVLFLAMMTKETTLLVLPISAAWLLFAWLGSPAATKKTELIRWGSLFATSLVAFSFYFLVRGQFLEVSLLGGTYSGNFEWSLSRFVDSTIRWTGWLIRDFAWIIPLFLILVADVLDRKLDQARLLVASVVWVGAWIAIYIPWEFAVEYYMLPVALGISVVASITVVSGIRRIRNENRKTLAWVALALAIPLWLASMSNNLSNARQQLAVDQANAQMLEYLENNTPNDGVVVINIQDENEYIYEIQAYFDALSSVQGASVLGYDPAVGLPQEATLLAVPVINNQPLLAIRMGIIEPTQQEWNRVLLGALQDSTNPTYQTHSEFRLSIVDLPRLLCPLISERGYCRGERPYVDTRNFEYGWNVYQIDGLGRE